jgi:hypothetical protein
MSFEVDLFDKPLGSLDLKSRNLKRKRATVRKPSIT